MVLKHLLWTDKLISMSIVAVYRRVFGSQTPVWWLRRSRCPSSHGNSTDDVWFIVEHLGRPPTVSGTETEDISIGSVFHIDAFFRGMDVDCCSDAQYQRIQQPMPACHHWPGLSAHSHSPSVRPGACDPTAEIAISRAHPAHAWEQGGTSCPDGPHCEWHPVPRGQPSHGLPDNPIRGHWGACAAARYLEQY